MKTRENKGRIEVQKGGGERDYLCKLFRVTPQMVWKALSFESDTDLAKKYERPPWKGGLNTLLSFRFLRLSTMRRVA